MQDKLNQKAFALSLASISLIFHIFFAFLISVAPRIMVIFGRMMFGIDITRIIVFINPSFILTHILVATVAAFVVGWLFATIYNYWSR